MFKYAYLDKYNKWNGPLSMRKLFRGINDFNLLTDIERAQKRWYPCEIVNEDYDSRTEQRTGPVWSFDEDRQVVIATYTVTDIPIDMLIQKRLSDVTVRRDIELTRGVEYEFPDGEIAMVQTRDSRDERNIMATGIQALALVMAGQGETPMQFRTEDDVLRTLTAQQMLEMTRYVGARGQEIYGISWQIKDEIAALTDPLAVVTHPGWIEDEVEGGV